MWWSKRHWALALLGAAICLHSAAAHARDAEVMVDGRGVDPIATAAVDRLPRAIAVTRDESYAYIANFNSDTLSILDLDTLKIIGGLDVGDGPIALELSPDNTLLWVTHFYDDTVWVVNIVTDTVESRISVDRGPLAIALAPDGSTAYVANSFSGSITVIDEAGRAATSTVWIGGFPQALALTPDGTRLAVAHGQTGKLHLLDTASGEVMAETTLAGNPRALAIAGSRVAVALADESYITVLRTADLSEEHRIAVAKGPHAFAPGPTPNALYVLSGEGRAVSLCDVATGAVRPHRLGEAEYLAIARAPKRGQLLISQAEPSQVLVWGLDAKGALRNLIPAAASASEAAPDADGAGNGVDEPKEVELRTSPGREGAAVPPDESPSGNTFTKTAQTIVNTHILRAKYTSAVPAVAEGAGEQQGHVPPPVDRLPSLRTTKPGAVAQPWGSGEAVVVLNASQRTLSILDVKHSAERARIPLPGQAGGVTSGPAGRWVYVADRLGQRVLAFDRDAGHPSHAWSLDSVPGAMAVTPDGGRLCVAFPETNQVALLDTGTGVVLGTVPTGAKPRALVIGPAGTRAYLANMDANSITVIDLQAVGVAATWSVGNGPAALAVTPDGARVAVVCSVDDTVQVLDATTGELQATIAVGDRPGAITLAPDGVTAYVANFLGASVTTLDLAAGQATGTLPNVQHPSGVALGAAGAYLYVSNRFADSVTILRLPDGRPIAIVPVGGGPTTLHHLAARPAG